MILITNKVGGYKPADALWQWVKRASLRLTRWVTWGRSRYSYLEWLLASIIHIYSALVMKRASRLLPRCLRCWQRQWGLDCEGTSWRSNELRTSSSWSRTGTTALNKQTCTKQKKQKQQGLHSEDGLTNLLFDYDLCDQLLGQRRRREIRQRGRLFARRSDPGRSLWSPSLRTCRFILTFVVTNWLSLSSQRSY